MPNRRDIIDEKDLVSSISQNLWIVDFTSQLYELHGNQIDDISDEDIEEIDSTIQSAVDEFHTSEGYDLDSINSLSNEELRTRARELDQAGSQAARYFNHIYEQAQSQQELSSELSTVIEASIRNTFEELVNDVDFSEGDTYVSTDIGDETLNQIYSKVEQSIEANLEGFVDEEIIDEVYDELGGLYEEVVSQGEETRQHTEREMDRALEEIHGRFDDLEDEIDGGSDSGDYDSLKDTILDIAEEYDRSSDETRSIREERNEDTSDILYD